jgi:hypothetical protein
MKTGDTVEGQLIYQRREDNARDYEITVVWRVLPGAMAAETAGEGTTREIAAMDVKRQKFLLAA